MYGLHILWAIPEDPEVITCSGCEKGKNAPANLRKSEKVSFDRETSDYAYEWINEYFRRGPDASGSTHNIIFRLNR